MSRVASLVMVAVFLGSTLPALRAADLKEKLAGKVDVAAVEPDTPLKDALAALARKHGFKYEFDRAAFKDKLKIDDPEGRPVKLCEFKHIVLGQALGALLREADATWEIRKEMLVIVPEADPKKLLLSRILDEAPTEALRKKISGRINFDGLPNNAQLRDALAYLSEKFDVAFLVDAKSFDTLAKISDIHQELIIPGIPPIRAIPLSTVLTVLLQPEGATFVLRGDTVLIVPEEAPPSPDAPRKTLAQVLSKKAPAVKAQLEKKLSLSALPRKVPLETVLPVLAEKTGATFVVDSRAWPLVDSKVAFRLPQRKNIGKELVEVGKQENVSLAEILTALLAQTDSTFVARADLILLIPR